MITMFNPHLYDSLSIAQTDYFWMIKALNDRIHELSMDESFEYGLIIITLG